MATPRKTAPKAPAPRKATGARRAYAKPLPRAIAAVKEAVPAHESDPGKGGETLKPDKAHKVKVLRDSFTMPKTEFAVLQALKQRALDGGRALKKSEVLRAGVLALAGMGDAAFLAAIAAVPALKTGRPAKA
jgi:hypothetical protein